MLTSMILVAVLVLAFSNGANDNFKGVATLYGSGTTDYLRAVVWGTATTLAGSLLALALASRLVTTFSGKGLVPDTVATEPGFVVAVVLGAAATVIIASRIGAPVSTTHALVGGLVGAGLARAPHDLAWGRLAAMALVPLVTSPLLAAGITAPLYAVLRAARRRAGIVKESCLCVEARWVPVRLARAIDGATAAMSAMPVPEVKSCRERYVGRVAGVDAQRVLDGLHYLSGGAMGFAGGLNDTPKIAAMLVAGRVLSPAWGISATAGVMALGGLLYARRVGETMSRGISAMNDGQGFTASLVTAALVLAASFAGLPVSTTHVSVGTLVGLGAVTRQLHGRRVLQVLLAWVVTLPMAAVLAAVIAGFA